MDKYDYRFLLSLGNYFGLNQQDIGDIIGKSKYSVGRKEKGETITFVKEFKDFYEYIKKEHPEFDLDKELTEEFIEKHSKESSRKRKKSQEIIKELKKEITMLKEKIAEYEKSWDGKERRRREKQPPKRGAK